MLFQTIERNRSRFARVHRFGDRRSKGGPADHTLTLTDQPRGSDVFIARQRTKLLPGLRKMIPNMGYGVEYSIRHSMYMAVGAKAL